MFNEFRKECKNALKNVFAGDDVKLEPLFTIPTVEAFGDLSTNICFQLTALIKKSPDEIAKLLASQIKAKGLIGDVKAEKGYLNFYINYFEFAKAILLKIGPEFGRGQGKEKIILEHTSANPDGPLHIGHLRNAVIGDTLGRILRFVGHETEVQYYLNDMGKQTAKVVWGMDKFKIGDGKKDTATAEVYVKASKIIEEQELDIEISKLLLRYEKGEKETVDEFVRAVEFCLEGIMETLSRLGIKHDKFVWESAFVRDGSVRKIIDDLSKTSYAEKDGEALILHLSEMGIDKEMVLTRGDGTTLYVARDLAHHAWKIKNGKCVNIWGADHKLVSDQLKAGLKILGLDVPEFIIHEFISLPEGSMSTRKGVFISADQLVDETVKKAEVEVRARRPDLDRETAKRLAEEIGVSSVRFNIARVAPEKSMVFRWEEALDFERQGAPFIQYAYARGRKILIKAGEKIHGRGTNNITEVEKRLIRSISRFPELLEESAASRKASVIANYAIDLSNAFHSFYMHSRVLGSREESFRLSLVSATVTVLRNVMALLGIKLLEDM
jgi:arginyl-tRNA synthetase